MVCEHQHNICLPIEVIIKHQIASLPAFNFMMIYGIERTRHEKYNKNNYSENTDNYCNDLVHIILNKHGQN